METPSSSFWPPCLVLTCSLSQPPVSSFPARTWEDALPVMSAISASGTASVQEGPYRLAVPRASALRAQTWQVPERPWPRGKAQVLLWPHHFLLLGLQRGL